jgi:hypothetical protein
MLRALTVLMAAAAVLALQSAPNPQAMLHTDRSSPGDLEVGGELAGLPPGSTRFVRYEDLLRQPLETYTVSDDTNFAHNTEISGLPLTSLAKLFGQDPESALIVAVCYDKYRTNYPRDYLATHHPLLVLRMNGQLRDHWPKSEYGGPMGPYLISHALFKPSFKVLSHEDEPQIPFGVTRIEFRRESAVFGVIRPPGEWPENSQVGQGFIIARQDCFRCHNMDAQGGTMAGRSWITLAASARSDSAKFKRIIRDPKSVTPDAKMPAHADYDDATLDALTAYFKAFKGAAAGRKANP